MVSSFARTALVLLCGVALIYGTALFPAAFAVDLGPAGSPGAAGDGTPSGAGSTAASAPSGVAIGSTLVVAATLRSPVHGVAPIVVFAGLAGALLAWDLGSHARSVGRDLGREARSGRVEFVHSGASTVVLLGATLLAAVVHHAFVPVVQPLLTRGAAGPAVVSLLFVLVAVLAFVVALYRRDRVARRLADADGE